MNILRKITIQNLKLNKKRSIVTTIGILLSVALITAVATMVTSFRESLIEYEKKSSGNYEYVFYDVPESEISFLKNNRSIKDLYLVSGLGYAKIESQNEAKPYAYVVSMDKDAMENLGLNLVEGKVPTNESEIVIPTSVKTNGTLDYKIGDYITLDIGQRQSEGYNLNQNNPYNIDTKEEIVNANTKTYKIVGIVKRMDMEPYTAPGYTFITYSENGGKLNDVYVYLTNKGLKNRYNVVGGIIGVSGKTLKDLEIGEYNKDEIAKAKYDHNQNTYLVKMLSSSFDDGTMRALVTIATVVTIIIIFTSVYCIKSSFNISYTEKIKSYAHLISVGATSKQIKKCVYYESFILGFIGIILGLLSGVFAAFVLIKIVNLLLGSAFVIEGFLVFKVNFLAILISIILSLLTIYLSSKKIAKKASQTLPIEAIRNPGEITLKKKIKYPKFINKLFGIGGVISYKNIKRNSKKYRTTVVSIIFCVAVYIGLSYFINTAFSLVKKEIGEYNYNLEVMLNEENEKARKEKIKQIESLENINRISFIRTIIINADYLKFTKKASEFGFNNDNINTISIKCVGKKEYDNYLQKLNIKGTSDYDAIIINNFIYSENGSKIEFNVLDYKDGENIELKNSETNSIVKLRAIKSTSEKPLGLENNGEAPVIIVSDETFDKIYNNNLSHLNLTSIYMDAKNANDTQDEIDKLFPNDDNVYVNNTNEYANQMNSIYIIVAIFLYGFIIVIAIIGITNIFNTITTNVALRRGEFASLRSIGMTTKEFNKMIFLESFFYCIKALIIGIPIGIILSLIIHRAFIGEMALIYHLPLKGIIISILIVFILIFSLMKYSVKKVNSKNILDSIRDENI